MRSAVAALCGWATSSDVATTFFQAAYFAANDDLDEDVV